MKAWPQATPLVVQTSWLLFHCCITYYCKSFPFLLWFLPPWESTSYPLSFLSIKFLPYSLLGSFSLLPKFTGLFLQMKNWGPKKASLINLNQQKKIIFTPPAPPTKQKRIIGLITVFNAILTGRQSGPKLQCLYGNPIADNFFQNWIFHNLSIKTLKY